MKKEKLVSLLISIMLSVAMAFLNVTQASGGGTFSDSGQSLGSSDSFGVALGDLDGDNDLDVAATGLQADDVIWYEGPSWTQHFIQESLDGANGMQIADIDGDDTLDRPIIRNPGTFRRLSPLPLRGSFFAEGLGALNVIFRVHHSLLSGKVYI